MTKPSKQPQLLGLSGATGVGVGAIVGGGILALAGSAFAITGPSAMLAFALNGLIALLTALSFAEMASKFPESGGTYTFSKKVLSVEAAFTVGWVVWFASIVASVLYAIGFAQFSLIMLSDILVVAESSLEIPATGFATPIAIITTIAISVGLLLRPAGGGTWINVTKCVVFGILVVGGFFAIARRDISESTQMLTPFFSGGMSGLFQAMGLSFIALQGFDLIAAVGGEIKQPSKTIPRAMVLSLGIAIAIYLPLLFVITTVGTTADQPISVAAAAQPEEIVAVAAKRFLGPVGYWLVMVAGVLSMYSALGANLFAASRIAQAMARDRTLPRMLSQVSSKSTPGPAIIVTTGFVILLILCLPDVGAAGAASSLIFLLTFALAHWIAILVRQRSGHSPPPFRTLAYPMVPVVGGVCCLALAIFQGVSVPLAGTITIVWLSLGGILFLSLFARQARLTDASRTARNPELVTLRGRSPLVLVPVANPNNAEAMVTLAHALVPPDVGRVLVHKVAVADNQWQPNEDPGPIERSQAVLGELLRISGQAGIRVETLTTIAPKPMDEIARVARLVSCESVLLGYGEVSDSKTGGKLESLLGAVDANVVVLKTGAPWSLSDARRILIPIAGRGGHEHLLATLLGSMLRIADREVTFLRIVPEGLSATEVSRARRELQTLVHEVGDGFASQVIQDDNAMDRIVADAENHDLLILGVQRHGRYKKLFGEFTRKIAHRTKCPMIVMSRRG